MDNSLAGGHGPPGDFDYTIDPELVTDNWIAPDTDQYSHHDQFVPQQNYQQFPTSHLPQFNNYGVPQQSPYSFQSPYGGQHQQHGPVDNFVIPQYDMSFSQAPSNTQSLQPSHSPFPYSNLGPSGSTISPQALQRNDPNISLGQSTNTQVNTSHGPSSAHNANIGFRQGWQNGITENFGRNTPNSYSGPYSQPSTISQGMVSYPSLNNPAPSTVGMDQVSGSYAPGQESLQTPLPPTKMGTVAQTSLRITHPDLLSSAQNVPFQRPVNAPFVIVDAEPVHLEIGGKSKGSVTKTPRNKSARASGTSTPSSAPKMQTPKSTSTTQLKATKPSHAKDIKSRIGVTSGIKSVDSPSPSLVSSSEDQSSSDDYEEDEDEEMELEELSDLREQTRPSDPVAAAGWDATGIVWVPRYRNAYREEIIKATPEFEKLIAGLREELKVINSDLTKAEAEKRPVDAQKLKDLRVVKRKTLQSVTFHAVKNGHHMILEQLGNSQKLVNSLVSILIDCIKMEDYDGELPRAVLKLLSQFKTLSDGFLQKVKFDAVEKRFNKKGDAEIKGYITAIRANTTEGKEKSSKVKEETGKAEKQKAQTPAQDAPKARIPGQISKVASTASGLKRTHEVDISNTKPNKKVASDATAVVSGQKVSTIKPRTPNLFDKLKRPGLKSAAKAPHPSAATAATPVKKPEPKTEAAPQPPPAQPSSNLAAILASIEKPREVSKPVEAPVGPPESPEEKAKRERKESRRHLRVHWKDGDSLVEIKLFKHDLAEDEGRQDNMLRDAHDDRSEGMMLKQRVTENIADEEDETPEIEYHPYPGLVSVDFSAMPGREKNFVTRGGDVAFNTPQQQVQQKRESVELMVVYTDPKDIPISPKEPSQTTEEESQVERTFGQPTQAWLVQRLQEIRLYGWEAAMSMAARRVDERNRSLGIPPQQSNMAHATSTSDLSTILSAMHGTASTQQHSTNSFGYQPPSLYPQIAHTTTSPQNVLNQPITQQQYNPTPQASLGTSATMEPQALAHLMLIIQPLMGKPFPATQPPEWMGEKSKAEWWEGYNRDKAKKEALEKMAADEAAAKVRSSQMHYPQISYAPPPPTMTSNSTPAYNDTQLQNIIAGLNNPNQPQPQQQQDWYSAWASANGSNGQHQTQAHNAQNQNFWDNNSNWKDTQLGTDSQDHHNNNRGRDNDNGEKELDPRFPGEKRRGKKPCKFWSDGKCAKGAKCGYLHEK